MPHLTIPIKFTHNGITYHGEFKEVFGAGDAGVFYLYINRFYWGRLRTYQDGWVFDSNDGMFKELAEWFGAYVSAYVDGIT
jgi:hypothetical protein